MFLIKIELIRCFYTINKSLCKLCVKFKNSIQSDFVFLVIIISSLAIIFATTKNTIE